MKFQIIKSGQIYVHISHIFSMPGHIFYLISQQFGTRECQQHHQLQVEELKFVRDPSGKTINVEWVEGLIKTRLGGLNKTK